MRDRRLGFLLTLILTIVVVLWFRPARCPVREDSAAPVEEPTRQAAGRVTDGNDSPDHAREVSGTVHDEHGAAIPGASVCLWSSALASTRLCTATNSQGRFQLNTAPVGSLAVGADGFADTLIVLETRTPDEVIVILRRGASLSGRVVDAFGGAVTGARVTVLRGDPTEMGITTPSETVALTASDVNGRFRVGVEDRQVEVRATASGYATGEATAWVPGADVQLTRAPASDIRGIVMDEASKPVPDVVVQARREGCVGGFNSTTTDKAGRFLISVASAANYTLEVATDNWDGDPVPVSVGIDTEIGDVRLVVSASLALHGRVLLGQVSCSGGQVTLRGPVTRTGPIRADGSVRIGRLLAGSYASEVHCAGALTAFETIDVSATQTAKTWRVSPGLNLRGTLHSARGEPRSGVLVRLEPNESDRVPLGFRPVPAAPVALPVECLTDEQGSFRCSGLSAGSYICSLHAGLRDFGTREITMGDKDDNVEWTLPSGGAIHVTVPGARNQAAVVADGPEFVFAQQTDEASFWLTDLAPGNYVVRYFNEDSGRQVNVASDGCVVEIALAPVAMEPLSGRVVDASGNPVPDAWVSARLARASVLGAQSLTALTNADGEFDFPEVPRGEYALRVESGRGTIVTTAQTSRSAVLRVPEQSSAPVDGLAVRDNQGTPLDLGFRTGLERMQGENNE